MTIKISSPSKPIGPISKIETYGPLPEFLVLTGRNGSGKTQLLRGIASGSIPVELDGEPIETSDICVLDYNSIPKPSGKFPDIWESEIQMFWSVFKNAHLMAVNGVVAQIQSSDAKLSQITESDLSPIEKLEGFLAGVTDDPSQIADWLKKVQESKDAAWEKVRDEMNRLLNSAKPPGTKRVNNKQVPQQPTSEFKLKQHLASHKVEVKQIVRNLLSQDVGDICDFDYDKLVAIWPPHSIGIAYFAEPLSAWFQKYSEACARHCRLLGLEAIKTEDRTIDLGGFTKKHGEPPWEIVNEAFAKARIPYEVNSPSSNALEVFSAQMTHTVTKRKVGLDSLSSGEKAVLFLLPKLAMIDEKLKSLPKLILFDEVDATLHPTLTRLLVSTIDRLTKDGDRRVILVTHSPSTVSLFGREKPNSIHLLEASDTNPCVHTLKKSSVDEAIHQLTDGLISVTSSSVFVITEAQVDATVYQSIYDYAVAKEYLHGHPNLVFLRASDEKNETGGGNGQVRQWVTKLEDAGLPNFRGLIDLDYGNSPQGIIQVLDRYAIENILLDPVLIFARLVEAREHANLLESGYPEVFDERHNISLLAEQSSANLQRIADTVVPKIREVKGPNDQPIEGSTEIEYLNGTKISVPTWFLLGRGKDIQEQVKAAFDSTRPNGPRLFSRLEPLADILTKNIPELIPKSLIVQFQKLQEPVADAGAQAEDVAATAAG